MANTTSADLKLTIQATGENSGTWGTKTFVFSDDLDATNRLFGNLQDAEGRLRKGPFWHFKEDVGSLAMLRNPINISGPLLDHYKQNWQIAKNIGHSLDSTDRTVIGRTSSEDRGVDVRANVVIATASLEVGFNENNGVGVDDPPNEPNDINNIIIIGKSCMNPPTFVLAS